MTKPAKWDMLVLGGVIMKVYVVESYDRLDDKSYVEGVFGTPEKAEEYVRDMYLETTDAYTITETELDKGYLLGGSFLCVLGGHGVGKAVT